MGFDKSVVDTVRIEFNGERYSDLSELKVGDNLEMQGDVVIVRSNPKINDIMFIETMRIADGNYLVRQEYVADSGLLREGKLVSNGRFVDREAYNDEISFYERYKIPSLEVSV